MRREEEKKQPQPREHNRYQPSQRFLDSIKKCVHDAIECDDKMNIFIEIGKRQGYSDAEIVSLIMSGGKEFYEYAKEVQEQLKIMEDFRVKER